MWYNPPGVWHAVENTGDEPFVLVFATVPNEARGLLAFFREISSKPGEDPKPITMEEFRRLGEEYDLHLYTPEEEPEEE
jgi:oxalate decarboxylase/phosphoglucose isomerase-like protein (cupin superfamily)